MIDENGNSVLSTKHEDPFKTLAQAAEDIPDAVVCIYQF
jgi:hypothetical protein